MNGVEKRDREIKKRKQMRGKKWEIEWIEMNEWKNERWELI